MQFDHLELNTNRPRLDKLEKKDWKSMTCSHSLLLQCPCDEMVSDQHNTHGYNINNTTMDTAVYYVRCVGPIASTATQRGIPVDCNGWIRCEEPMVVVCLLLLLLLLLRSISVQRRTTEESRHDPYKDVDFHAPCFRFLRRVDVTNEKIPLHRNCA